MLSLPPLSYLILISFRITAITGELCTGGDVYTPASNQYACLEFGLNEISDEDRCIHSSLMCDSDSHPDCNNGDDEWSCPTYDDCIANGGYDCPYSTRDGEAVCIPATWGCAKDDPIWDCPLQEDVASEFCDTSACEGSDPNYFQCNDSGRCIEWTHMFDGYYDCLNGMDESDTLSYVTTSDLSTDFSWLTVNVSMSVQVKTNQLCLTMNGPSIVWFGIGFGSQLMANTYAIIVSGDGSVNETKLGTDHSSHQTLNTIVNVSRNVVTGDHRIVSLCRDASFNNSDYFSFDPPLFTTDVIWAYGVDSTFGPHFSYGTVTLSWKVDWQATVAPSVAPTAHPTAHPTLHPTDMPSIAPTHSPSLYPSQTPSNVPSIAPTIDPHSLTPTIATTVSAIISPPPTDAPTQSDISDSQPSSSSDKWDSNSVVMVVIIVISIVALILAIMVVVLLVYICRKRGEPPKRDEGGFSRVNTTDVDSRWNDKPIARRSISVDKSGTGDSRLEIQRLYSATRATSAGAKSFTSDVGVTDV